MHSLKIQSFTGNAVAPYLSQLALLRIEIFRDYPYLYEGSLDYEQKYLKRLITYPQSLLILVFDEDKIVGASTGNPLKYNEDFQAPFIQAGHDITKYFYCGESLLQKPYRAKGMGTQFFHIREAHARQLHYPYICFCAVERPANHPMRPKEYRPLDPFWEKLGYIKHPELTVDYPWQEIGQPQETEHPLTFWIKELL